MRFIILLLVAVLSTSLSSCKQSLETTIAKTSHSIAAVETVEGYCSSFYMGNNIFLTAQHCLPSVVYTPIILTFEDGSRHYAGIQATDKQHDLAALYTINDPHLPTMQLWDEDKPLRSGQSIVAVGFPAYLNEAFSFEVGYVINISYDSDFKRDFVIARSIAHSGESGGPVVDVETGRIIGMVDKGGEHIEVWPNKTIHTHAPTALITPFYNISDFLKPLLPQPKHNLVIELPKF